MSTKNDGYTNSKHNAPVVTAENVDIHPPHIFRDRPFEFKLEQITAEDWRKMSAPRGDPYGIIEFIESGMDSMKVSVGYQVCPLNFYRRAYGWAYSHHYYGVVHHNGDYIWYTRSDENLRAIKKGY